MSPFRLKEAETYLPRGKTALAKDVYLIHPDNRPDDEALIALENCGNFRPVTVDIVGREGKEIFINPPSRVEPVVLTWEPAIEVQVERIIKDKEFERYFWLTNNLNIFWDKLVPKGSGVGRQMTVAVVLTLPFLGVLVSDVCLDVPKVVYDFSTKHWQKEKVAIEVELKEKKGLASGR